MDFSVLIDLISTVRPDVYQAAITPHPPLSPQSPGVSEHDGRGIAARVRHTHTCSEQEWLETPSSFHTGITMHCVGYHITCLLLQLSNSQVHPTS